ncbi:UNVERIFIED_CONTAM: hypothetical protein FKN15_042242 [Acipenser sinensis]
MDSQPLFNMDHFEDNELLYALVETSEQDTTKEPEILGTGKKVFKKQCDSKEGETLHAVTSPPSHPVTCSFNSGPPQPKWEEPEHPQPKWEEPEHPAQAGGARTSYP